MTLISMRRSLRVMAAMVFIVVAGSWIWLGKEAVSGIFLPALFAFFLLVLLAEIVARVEDRIAGLEEKLKEGRQ